MRVRTGHDFSNYKRATMLRRIGRRMQVHGIAEIGQYVATLRERPGEVEALLRDLLISVTNFFRDHEAFAALEANLPRLFANKSLGDYVRVWVAGCATGEEAYSVAMLLREYANRLDRPPEIQIFATDIDEDAIALAREGRYTENITADVSPERLRQFFNQEQGFYRVKKDIRDMVLFAVHNLLRDPPFSKLDLVTCRNLLIYLDRDVQQQLLKLFHFVLRPDGLLLLGASEFADGVPDLFGPIDKHNRLFARHNAQRATNVLPSLPLAGPRLSRAREHRSGAGGAFVWRAAPAHAGTVCAAERAGESGLRYHSPFRERRPVSSVRRRRAIVQSAQCRASRSADRAAHRAVSCHPARARQRGQPRADAHRRHDPLDQSGGAAGAEPAIDAGVCAGDLRRERPRRAGA